MAWRFAVRTLIRAALFSGLALAAAAFLYPHLPLFQVCTFFYGPQRTFESQSFCSRFGTNDVEIWVLPPSVNGWK
jgi:hypothetical protein